MDPLSLDELEAALDLYNICCPGLDGLRFFLFKALPPEAKLCLLEIYNDILRTGMVPESWYRTKVVLILEPGKNSALSDKFDRLWTETHGGDDLYTSVFGQRKMGCCLRLNMDLGREEVPGIVWHS
jgi:hypothetical protein